MDLKSIFDVFSRKKNRGKDLNKVIIQEDSRNRIIMLLNKFMENDWKSGSGYISMTNINSENVYLEIRDKFKMKLGKMYLYGGNLSPLDDIANFLYNCEGELFLDFIEYCFRTEEFKKISLESKNRFIEEINYIFQVGNIEFTLTNQLEKWNSEKHPSGGVTLTLESMTYPCIINKEDEYLSSNVIGPVLTLLSDSRLKNANDEFLEGLTHYKKKRYKESINSSCSALESVMKIIYDCKGWKHEPNATGLPLLKKLIEISQSPIWYEGLIAPSLTVRNRLGAHGKGTTNILVSKAQARFEINIVASQIIFLFDEYM